MKLSDVHEDLRPAFKNKFFPPIHWPGVLWLGQKLVKFPSQGLVDGVDLIESECAGNEVRIYVPQERRDGRALVIFHGGGLIGGDPNLNDWTGSCYAAALGAVVFSPGYRRAPANPAPAALNDCWEAWQWVKCEADNFSIDKQRIALCGVSAGGGLAACLAQRLLDEGKTQPAAQVLTYPMLDDRTAARKELDRYKHLMWNNRSNRVGWSAYLGEDNVGARTLPDYLAAARRKDLAGLPPTFIGFGDIDLFAEENLDYARRLADAGVECVMDVLPGAPHGFDYFGKDIEIVRDFRERMIAFLEHHLSR